MRRGSRLVLAAMLAVPLGAPRSSATVMVLAGGSVRGDAGNPASLHATLLLGRRAPGAAPRVRLEWEQVSGTPTYLLTGTWMAPDAWTLRSQEYRVTSRTATRWDSRRVTFDVSLPAGSHSWKLVAVRGPHDEGDFARPTHVSFDVR